MTRQISLVHSTSTMTFSALTTCIKQPTIALVSTYWRLVFVWSAISSITAPMSPISLTLPLRLPTMEARCVVADW